MAPRPPPIQPPPIVSDDSDSPAAGDSSDSDSDSDSGGRGGRKRARPTAVTADSMDTGHNAAFAEAARRMQARRTVWSDVLAEDGITADLAGGLGALRSGPRVERDIESYQLPERPQVDNPRKRGFEQASRGWQKKKRSEKVLLEALAVTEDSPAEQVAADIALKLHEEKPEIIGRSPWHQRYADKCAYSHDASVHFAANEATQTTL